MNHSRLLELLESPDELAAAITEDRAIIQAIKEALMPNVILNEAMRQKSKWGESHDSTHDLEGWYSTLSGRWDGRAEWRRQNELRDAMVRFEYEPTATDDDQALGGFDHIMGEYGAIAVSYFRARSRWFGED